MKSAQRRELARSGPRMPGPGRGCLGRAADAWAGPRMPGPRSGCLGRGAGAGGLLVPRDAGPTRARARRPIRRDPPRLFHRPCHARTQGRGGACARTLVPPLRPPPPAPAPRADIVGAPLSTIMPGRAGRV